MNVNNMKLLEKFDSLSLHSLDLENGNGNVYLIMSDESCISVNPDYKSSKTLFTDFVKELLEDPDSYKSQLIHALKFIKELGNDLAEINTEISDSLLSYDNNIRYSYHLPNRFIKADIDKNIEIEFDTCTTELSYRNKNSLPAQWVECYNHRYLKNNPTDEEKDEYDR